MLPTKSFGNTEQRPGPNSDRGQGPFDDIRKIAGEFETRHDALQGRLRLGAAARLKGAPAPEGSGHPRGYLRVFSVEREDGIGNEIIAGAVWTVELGRIAVRKSADQRADPVGVGHRKGRMAGQRADVVQGIG